MLHADCIRLHWGSLVAPFSYVRGAAVPLHEKTLSQALRDQAERIPEHEALVVRHQNIRLTWRDFDAEVTRVARGLAGLGLRPNDRAAIWASNCAEWVLLQYAAGRAGVILVNINPACRSYELSYVLKKSRIRALFLHERDAHSDFRQILTESRNGDRLPLEHVIWLGTDSWTKMLAGGADYPEDAAGPQDVANIQYTSGTTGLPKGAMLTHYNLVNNGRSMAAGMKMTERDRICAPVPLYHCFGSVIGSMVSLASGAALILPAPQFDTKATLEAVHHERATALYGVPTMFIAELNHPMFKLFDLSSLRTGIMAGSPCPMEIMKRVIGEMHAAEITIAYGLTEASPVMTQTRTDDPIEVKVGTVGRALPGIEVKVWNPETGRDCATGEQGELCCRGYNVMKGYYKLEEETAKVIDAEGWLHSGDLGDVDAAGNFRVTGRIKDMIIRGGENIYPREIEEYLLGMEAIRDVQVAGVASEKYGEEVAAFVILKAGMSLAEEELRDYCRGEISRIKIPKYVFFVEDFPMTGSGKIQKYKLRELGAKLAAERPAADD
jgi:fatty-acyl-CoA synthase